MLHIYSCAYKLIKTIFISFMFERLWDGDNPIQCISCTPCPKWFKGDHRSIELAPISSDWVLSHSGQNGIHVPSISSYMVYEVSTKSQFESQ